MTCRNDLGTSRVNAYKLIEDALNLKETKVFDQIINPDGSKTSVLNKENHACRTKAGAIKRRI